MLGALVAATTSLPICSLGFVVRARHAVTSYNARTSEFSGRPRPVWCAGATNGL